jgi:hypothetical protein
MTAATASDAQRRGIASRRVDYGREGHGRRGSLRDRAVSALSVNLSENSAILCRADLQFGIMLLFYAWSYPKSLQLFGTVLLFLRMILSEKSATFRDHAHAATKS